MTSIPTLNDETWLMLVRYAAEAFNELTLSRGFQYFKQQRVTSLNTVQDHTVQATVTGEETYTVRVNVARLAASSCTCPVAVPCKHIAAVMMELGERMGYPVSQLVNARTYLKQLTPAIPPDQLPGQLRGKDVFGWHEWMDALVAGVKPAYNQNQYIEELRRHLQPLNSASVPFSAIEWKYFELHQELFIVRKIRKLSEKSEYRYYTSFVLPRLYAETMSLLRQKSAILNFSLAEERLKQTLRYMQRQMAEETGNRCMEYGLYMTMWELWVAGRPDADLWAAQQLAELEKLETPALSAAAAQVFLYLRLSQYEEAQAVVESSDMINNVSTDMLLTFLNYIAGAKNWERLTNWLAKTAPAFYERRVQELATYIRLWNEVVPHVPGAERQMWSILEQALPDSMWIIEDLLYEQHRWKLWLELQIQQEHGPLHHKVGVLQPIEKEAPELLLPYYHQAIHRCVSLKTRQDYKQAVKLLKRLEKVYKKMKMQGRWERFLIGFAERHSRLRALQEELKKGKLLP